MQNFVRSTLSLTFVIAAARVVFNIKARMTRETTWSLELKGELTKQRRVEAVDKLLTVLTLLVASVFGLQAIGLDGKSCLPAAMHFVAVCSFLRLAASLLMYAMIWSVHRTVDYRLNKAYACQLNPSNLSIWGRYAVNFSKFTASMLNRMRSSKRLYMRMVKHRQT